MFQWSHVALTYDKTNGTGCLYFNGSLATNAPLGHNFTPKTGVDLYFGARVCGSGAARWCGGIDEVSLYNVALSGADIQAIYNAQTTGKCFAAPLCVAPLTDLVSWWRAENNTADQQGLNTNAAWQGSPAYTSSGEVGFAFSLNGAGSYVHVPYSSTLDVGSGAGLTLEAWINPADTASQHPIIEWNSGPPTYSYGAHFWISVPGAGTGPGCLFANLFDTAGGNHWISSAAALIPVGRWSHAALTYDRSSSNAFIYLNGLQVASNHVGSIQPQTGPGYGLYFGARPSGSGQGWWWYGGIDEVSVYNQALTAGQIQAIFNAGSAGKCTNSPPTLPMVSLALEQNDNTVAIEPSSPGGLDWTKGFFHVLVSPVQAANLTVFYSMSGTAINGTDYDPLLGSLVIGVGQTSVEFDVYPLDAGLDFDKTAICTLTPTNTYTVGASNSIDEGVKP